MSPFENPERKHRTGVDRNEICRAVLGRDIWEKGLMIVGKYIFYKLINFQQNFVYL